LRAGRRQARSPRVTRTSSLVWRPQIRHRTIQPPSRSGGHPGSRGWSLVERGRACGRCPRRFPLGLVPGARRERGTWRCRVAAAGSVVGGKPGRPAMSRAGRDSRPAAARTLTPHSTAPRAAWRSIPLPRRRPAVCAGPAAQGMSRARAQPGRSPRRRLGWRARSPGGQCPPDDGC